MNKRILKALLSVVSALSLILSACNPSHAQTSTPQPTLALFLPLSGPLAEWGNAMRLGAEMAASESEPKAHLIIEDTQFQPSMALSAYEKVLRAERPDALIVFGSGVSLAIAPRAERERIPMISLATSDDIQRGKRYVFRLMMSGNSATQVLLPEVTRRNLSRIAAISTTQDGMLAYQQSFVSAAGDKIVYTTDVAPSEREFSSIIAKVLTLTPDAVYSTLLPPQGAIFAKQIRALGFKGQIFSANQVELASEIAAGGDSFEGLFYAADGDSSREGFEARFLAHHKVPADNMAGLSFDAVRMLGAALATANAPGHLESLTNYRGALGIYNSLPDHTFAIPAHIRTIRNGRGQR
jgi:branched-chain amino acid transport system substrate-binding protein